MYAIYTITKNKIILSYSLLEYMGSSVLGHQVRTEYIEIFPIQCKKILCILKTRPGVSNFQGSQTV